MTSRLGKTYNVRIVSRPNGNISEEEKENPAGNNEIIKEKKRTAPLLYNSTSPQTFNLSAGM